MINQPIHNHIVESLLTTLAEQGISSQQLFERPELGTFEDRETQIIEPTKIPSLLQAAFALTNDPTLMIGLGQKVDITNLGTFGFALMSCATLQEALKLLLRYQSIASPGLSFRPLESDKDIIPVSYTHLTLPTICSV